MKLPDAYLVIYKFNGIESKFITLDKSSADDFAVRYRGVVYPLKRVYPKWE